MASTAEVVRALAAPVGDLGGRWLVDREVLGPSRRFGYPNRYAYYLAGRGGVLGDVNAAVAQAALGFFEPSMVRKTWEAGVGVEGARASAARYGAACAQWGRSRLSDFEPAARLAELNRHVIDSVDPVGMALFAGWRAEPRPDDSAGLAYFTTHLMRELRGGAHIAAVVCTGISPLDAILTSEGEVTAQLLGWTAPFPDVSHLLELRAETEAITDQTMIRFFDNALNADQSTELLNLVLAMKAHLDNADQQAG